MPMPAPPCFSHPSSENTYSFPTSYGFASVVPTYPVFSAQCVRVAFVSKPRVLRELSQANKVKFETPAEPQGPGPGSVLTAGALSAPVPTRDLALCPSLPSTTAQTAAFAPPAFVPKPASKLSEREHSKGDAKHCYGYVKRLCLIRPRPKQCQQTATEETLKVPHARPGLQECGVPDRWMVLTRPRRVTKRVGVGCVKTPQPYQRRRRSLIQRQLLQIPGESAHLSSLGRSNRYYCVTL